MNKGGATICCEDEGYTLLEVLVGVAILALLTVPISSSISLALSTWTTVHGKTERQEQVFMARSRLSEWVRSAYPFDASRQNLRGENLLLGSANMVEFSTNLHPDPQRDGLFRLQTEFQDGRLLVRTKPDFNYIEDAGDWNETVLLDGIRTFNASYMLGVAADGEPIWLPEWGVLLKQLICHGQ